MTDTVGTPRAAATCSGPELFPTNRSHAEIRAIISRTVTPRVTRASGVAAAIRSARACSPGPDSTMQAAPVLSVSAAMIAAKLSGDQRWLG